MTTPQGQVPEALGYEQQRAIMEGERNASLENYAKGLPVHMNSIEVRAYEAGFTNGWQRASHGQAPAGAVAPAIDTDGVFPEWRPGSSKFKDWCAKYFGGDADETYLAEAVLHLPRASEGPLKAVDAFELRRLLAEERATTRQLVRALAEATEPSSFMGEPVIQPTPAPQADSVTAPAGGAAAGPEDDDSLMLCVSDLEHSAIYDNHVEMQACIRSVAARVLSLAAAPTPPAKAADSVQDLQPVHDAVTIDLLNERVAYLESKLKAADSVLEDAALLKARHGFLLWNRSLQPSPIESSVEYSVFDKALELYDAARKQGANHD